MYQIFIICQVDSSEWQITKTYDTQSSPILEEIQYFLEEWIYSRLMLQPQNKPVAIFTCTQCLKTLRSIV